MVFKHQENPKHSDIFSILLSTPSEVLIPVEVVANTALTLLAACKPAEGETTDPVIVLVAESLIASSASARCPKGIANALASGIVDCLIKEPPTQTPAEVSTITFDPVATRLMALFSSINNAMVCGDSGYQEGNIHKPGTVTSFLNMSPAVLAPQDEELA
jgi:hypothetical protein